MKSIINSTGLLVENTNQKNLDSMTVNVENTSFFIEALDFITKHNKTYNDSSKQLYKNLLESDNIDLVHESFATHFANSRKVIDLFLANIISVYNRYVNTIDNMYEKEKHILKMVDPKAFKPRHNFEISGYNYTISDKIPNIDALNDFVEDFLLDKDGSISSIINNLNMISSKEGKYTDKDVARCVQDSYDTLVTALEDKWYDKFRAELLGYDDKRISQTDYANELFAIFRDDSSAMVDVEIDATEYKKAYEGFKGCKQYTIVLHRQLKDIEKEYNEIRRQLEDVQHKNYDKDGNLSIIVANGDRISVGMTNDIMTNVDVLIKAKCNQVQEMTAIHLLAFSAKLDAVIDCFRQDKNIIYKGLYNISNMEED